jgi:hypothetical protein
LKAEFNTLNTAKLFRKSHVFHKVEVFHFFHIFSLCLMAAGGFKHAELQKRIHIKAFPADV